MCLVLYDNVPFIGRVGPDKLKYILLFVVIYIKRPNVPRPDGHVQISYPRPDGADTKCYLSAAYVIVSHTRKTDDTCNLLWAWYYIFTSFFFKRVAVYSARTEHLRQML